jgi:hypothetical protein
VSYDVWIGEESFNYTSNVSSLFYDHIAQDRNRGGIHELDGLTGKQAVEVLYDAFIALDRSYLNEWREAAVGAPAFCAKYDAPNGWGSAVGAILFLARIMGACARNPRKKVRVSA